MVGILRRLAIRWWLPCVWRKLRSLWLEMFESLTGSTNVARHGYIYIFVGITPG